VLLEVVRGEDGPEISIPGRNLNGPSLVSWEELVAPVVVDADSGQDDALNAHGQIGPARYDGGEVANIALGENVPATPRGRSSIDHVSQPSRVLVAVLLLDSPVLNLRRHLPSLIRT
jgi:hypothetical protein